MMPLTVVQFPDHLVTLDIPASLRLLADQVEKGEYGDAHNLAWVIDCGDSVIHLGLMGKAPEPATTGYFLFAIAQHKLITTALS